MLDVGSSKDWRLEVAELRAHRTDFSENGDERVISTAKPFTLKVALLDADGATVDNDLRLQLKATLLYENGRAVEMLNEPPLLGVDALLERGLATFNKLQIRVLSSQRQLQRFRVHVAAQPSAYHGSMSVISDPVRTLTKIRSRGSHTCAMDELRPPLESPAKSARQNDTFARALTPLDSGEKRSATTLWKVIDDHGEQLRLLQAQHLEILKHLREIAAVPRAATADSPLPFTAVEMKKTGVADAT